MGKFKLSRQKAHRVSLERNLLTSLVLHKRLVTTDAKAKQVKPLADKLLHKAQTDQNLSTKRSVGNILHTKKAVKELFEVVVPKLPKTKGSLVKLVKVEPRVGDRANRSALVITKKPEEIKKKTTKKLKPHEKK